MNQFQKLLLLLIIVTNTQFVFAQDTLPAKKSRKELKMQRINAIIKQEEEGVIKYKKHFVAGFKLTNDGYGGFLEKGYARSVNKSLLFQVDIAERKHVKEEKQSYYGYSSPFIFGKINYFYPVKLGVQEQFLLGNKGNKNGVSVTANFGGGISLGLLKPYLVEVDKGNNTYEFVGYNSPDSLYFMDINSITNGPGFSNGWSQLKIKPGIYAKSAVRFDYGKYNEMLNAIEIGGFAEFYSGKIQQMIYMKEKQFYLGMYVSVLFGRRK